MKRDLRFFAGLGFIFFIAFLNYGCTRNVPEAVSLKITLPTGNNSSNKPGAQAIIPDGPNVPGKLEIVIVNLRANPSAPAKAYEFHNIPGNGSEFTLSINSEMPISKKMMVQVLCVYKDSSTQAMQFAYGDTEVDSEKSGIIQAEVGVSLFGQSNEEGRIGGRYVTSESGGIFSGPTGTVVTQFVPPNLKPPMTVDVSEILNGWFAVMILDGSQSGTGAVDFKYKIINDNGTVSNLFSNVTGVMNLSNPYFSGSTSNDNIMAKVAVPTSFKNDGRDGSVKVYGEGASQYIVGWFAETSALKTALYSADKRACVPGSSYSGTINGLYADAKLLVPLSYVEGGGDPTYITGISTDTGTDSSSEPLCRDQSQLNSTSLNIFHNKLGSGREGVFGIEPPFSILNPDKEHGGYVNISVIQSVTTFVNLQAKVLNDVWGPGLVEGITILMKPFGGSSNESDNDENVNCLDRYISRGFKVAKNHTSAPDSNGNLFMTVNNPPGYAEFSNNQSDPNSAYRWEYALCPYRVVAGRNKYFSRGLREGCIGDCSQNKLMSFGNKIPVGPASTTVIVDSPTSYYDLGGVTARVTNIFNSSETILTVGSSFATSVNTGDEVIAILQVKNGNDGCGTSPDLDAGRFELLKVLNSTSGDITVRKGTFLDMIDPALDSDTNGVPNLQESSYKLNSCYVNIVKVVQLGNLKLEGSGLIQASPFAVDSSGGGGILAIRVSGVLDLTGVAGQAIMANGYGYPGGDPTSGFAGLSFYGPNSSGWDSSAIGRAGSGGTHMGRGGQGGATDGNTPTLAPAPISFSAQELNHDMPFLFGSGGNPAGGSGHGYEGGAGGGMVFVAAAEIKVGTGTTVISANGANGSAVTGGRAPGGGGAGGTVLVYAKKISSTSSGILEVQAKGGNGANSSAPYRVSGGGGGGGFVRVQRCASLSDAGIVVTNVNGGSRSSVVDDEDAGRFSTAGSPGFAVVQQYSECTP